VFYGVDEAGRVRVVTLGVGDLDPHCDVVDAVRNQGDHLALVFVVLVNLSWLIGEQFDSASLPAGHLKAMLGFLAEPGSGVDDTTSADLKTH